MFSAPDAPDRGPASRSWRPNSSTVAEVPPPLLHRPLAVAEGLPLANPYPTSPSSLRVGRGANDIPIPRCIPSARFARSTDDTLSAKNRVFGSPLTSRSRAICRASASSAAGLTGDSPSSAILSSRPSRNALESAAP